MRREIRDHGKLFSARHRRFCGKARAGTSVPWHPWFGWARGLAPFLAHPPQQRHLAPRPNHSPAWGRPLAASTARPRTSGLTSHTVLTRRQDKARRCQDQAVTDSSAVPPGCSRGYARVSDGEACPRPNSDGRAGPNPNAYGKPSQWEQGPVTNRPTPHLISGQRGQGGLTTRAWKGEISPVSLHPSVGFPTRARHLSMPIAFGGAYPAGGCAPGGLKGQMPPNDLESMPPLWPLPSTSPTGGFVEKGWRHPGRLRADPETRTPTSRPATPPQLGTVHMRQQGVVPLLCAESLL